MCPARCGADVLHIFQQTLGSFKHVSQLFKLSTENNMFINLIRVFSVFYTCPSSICEVSVYFFAFGMSDICSKSLQTTVFMYFELCLLDWRFEESSESPNTRQAHLFESNLVDSLRPTNLQIVKSNREMQNASILTDICHHRSASAAANTSRRNSTEQR